MSPLFEMYCSKCLEKNYSGESEKKAVFEVMIPLDKLDRKVKCPNCKSHLKKRITPVRFTWR